MNYKVVEKFVSIDGEGIRTGLPVIFLRFAGCNLNCSYCDSLYANENPEYETLTKEQIVAYCESTGFKRITVTGGEPLITKHIIELITVLEDLKYDINIETNGSMDISKCNEKSLITMDYKCPSSGMEDKMLPDNFKYLQRNDVLKFVVGTQEDLERMKEILELYKPKCNIFVSPVFGQIELVRIVNFIIENKLKDVRMQLQLHKLCWPPTMRGV